MVSLVCWSGSIAFSLPASLQDIRDQQAFKRNIKTANFNHGHRMHARHKTVSFVMRYWSRTVYGVGGALYKREREP